MNSLMSKEFQWSVAKSQPADFSSVWEPPRHHKDLHGGSEGKKKLFHQPSIDGGNVKEWRGAYFTVTRTLVVTLSVRLRKHG